MRTRASGRVSPVPCSPVPTRPRKRPGTADDDVEQESEDPAKPSADADNASITVATPVTPSKPAKRVRFSDPGPPPVLHAETSGTGLTPCLRRTSLDTTRSPVQRRTKRASLPARLPSSSSNTSPSREVHFKPLKQLLDDRLKRRLRRNHFSEEVNSYEQEYRREERTRHELAELAELRDQAQRRENKVNELVLELELQRQLGITVNEEEEERVRDLQREVVILREEVERGQESAKSTAASFDYRESLTDEDFPDIEMENEPPDAPLGAEAEAEGAHADTSTLAVQPEERSTATRADASAQTSETASSSAAALADTRTSLLSLGFHTTDVSPNQPPKDPPSPTALASQIQDAFRATRLELERLLPGETPQRLASPAASLLPTLLSHIRRLASSLTTAHSRLASERNANTALRTQFDSALARIALLDHANQRIAADAAHTEEQLAAENAERRTSAEKLQAALESYREEVRGLEELVERVEGEKRVEEERAQCALRVVRDVWACWQRCGGEMKVLVGGLEGGDAACDVGGWAFTQRSRRGGPDSAVGLSSDGVELSSDGVEAEMRG